jgi:archaellum component FlaC
MSETPLGAIFQLQRETIKQTEAVAEELMRTPAEISELLTEGAGTQRELQEQTLELTRQSIHRSLDAAESVVGNEINPLRASVDDTFETLEQQQDEAFAIIESEYDAVSEDLVDQLHEQVELVVELNEQIEQQVTELLEDGPGDTAIPDDFLSDFEDQLTAVTEQFEAQLDSIGNPSGESEPTEIEIKSGESEDPSSGDEGTN